MVTPDPVSLFTWFAQFLAGALGRSLSGSPAQVLKSLGFPPARLPWLKSVEDGVYPLKTSGDGLIPDLETRQYDEKRRSGQFYTPERLIEQLFEKVRVGQDPPANALDPACGDGAFLVQLAQKHDFPFDPLPVERLAGWDIDPQALLICLARLLKAGGGKQLPRLEQRDFLLAPPDRPFDLVVSNPPYRVNLPDLVKAKLKALYTTAEGEQDLYTFFLEGGLNALSPDGTLLMLTSHTYLVNHQCRKIREFIFGRARVEGLFLLPSGFFRMAPGVLPVVLWAKRSPPVPVLPVFNDYSPTDGWKTSVTGNSTAFLSPTGLRRALRTPDLAALLADMERATVRLGDIARIGVGIQESTTRGRKISRFVADTPANDSWVKVLKGREIEAFRVRWEGKYLDYGPHLTYAGDPEIFRGPKILYQNLRNETLHTRIVAALDHEGFFPKNSLSFICRPTPPYTLEFLVGWLNSSLVNCWFRENFFSFHITVTQMRGIPLPRTPIGQRRVERVVKEILEVSPDLAVPPALLETLDQLIWEAYFPGRPAWPAKFSSP